MERFSLQVLSYFESHNNGSKKDNNLRSEWQKTLNLAAIENVSPLKHRFAKEKRPDPLQLSKTNSKSAIYNNSKHEQFLKTRTKDNLQKETIKIQVWPKGSRIQSVKNHAKSWGGDHNFKKFGENSCIYNKFKAVLFIMWNALELTYLSVILHYTYCEAMWQTLINFIEYLCCALWQVSGHGMQECPMAKVFLWNKMSQFWITPFTQHVNLSKFGMLHYMWPNINL